MSRLLPVNCAVCPRCRGKATRRIGFSEKQRGSIWSCADCVALFIVPLLRLAKGTG